MGRRAISLKYFLERQRPPYTIRSFHDSLHAVVLVPQSQASSLPFSPNPKSNPDHMIGLHVTARIGCVILHCPSYTKDFLRLISAYLYIRASTSNSSETSRLLRGSADYYWSCPALLQLQASCCFQTLIRSRTRVYGLFFITSLRALSSVLLEVLRSPT